MADRQNSPCAEDLNLNTDNLLNGAMFQINDILGDLKAKASETGNRKLNINFNIKSGSLNTAEDLKNVLKIGKATAKAFPTANITLNVDGKA